ncbi:hypothetical protein Tco_0460380, partial [Tanacetum coccineum]
VGLVCRGRVGGNSSGGDGILRSGNDSCVSGDGGGSVGVAVTPCQGGNTRRKEE